MATQSARPQGQVTIKLPIGTAIDEATATVTLDLAGANDVLVQLSTAINTIAANAAMTTEGEKPE